MQKKIKIFILALVILFGFCFVRDFLVKSLIGTVVTNVTGAPTRVGGLSLSILRQSIKISNLKIYNPEGFPNGVLIDIPKIRASGNMFALLGGKVHLKQLDLEIKEISMVKNKKGKLNVDSLKIANDQADREEAKKPVRQPALQIDIFNLGMGRVVSKDYSSGVEPVIKVYAVNLKKSYKNIVSVQQLVALIISEPLKAAGIQGLKMYGVSMLAGVAALPVVAAFTLTGKDHAQETFNVSWQRAYDAGLSALKKAGVVKSEDKASGIINAVVDGVDVTLKLKKNSANSTEVTISARKFIFPQPEIASGVIYRLKEELR
jgi:hypothetical protein